MIEQDILSNIYLHVSNGDTNLALDTLDKYANNHSIDKKIKQEIAILTNNLNRINYNKRIGIIKDSEYGLEINKINHSILELAQIYINIKEITLDEPSAKKRFSTKKLIYFISGFLILLLFTTLIYINKATDSEAFELIKNSNSAYKYQDFIRKYPNSKYAIFCLNKVDSIEHRHVLDLIRSNDPNSLIYYCKQNPNSKFNDQINSIVKYLNIKPLMTIDKDYESIVHQGLDYLVFDNGNKIAFTTSDNSIDIIDISTSRKSSINFDAKNFSGMTGLSISRNGKIIAFFNVKKSQIELYSTLTGKQISKIPHKPTVFNINIRDDGARLLVDDELGSVTVYDNKGNKLNEVKRREGSWANLSSIITPDNNKFIVFDDHDDLFRLYSFGSNVPYFSLSMYLNEGWYNANPIFDNTGNFMILPIVENEDCSSNSTYAFCVYNIKAGRFLYRIDNEKIVNIDSKDQTNFFSLSDNFLFKRDVTTSKIIDTLCRIALPIDYVSINIDPNKKVVATSSNFYWNRVQIWDIETGNRIWGTGVYEEDNYCADEFLFLNDKYFLTKNESSIKIWQSKDIVK